LARSLKIREGRRDPENERGQEARRAKDNKDTT
jgi:hypothetical protein